MALSASARLTAIETAITRIEAGAESYSIGNRSVTHHDLGTLYAERRMLLREVQRESRGGLSRLARIRKAKNA